MAKEVKKPRKPATKKVAKEKKVKEITVQIESTPASEILELQKESGNLNPESIVIKTNYTNDNSDDATGPEMLEDEDIGSAESPSEESPEAIDPQEIIEEFTEATKRLDDIVISKNPEETLKKELERANEVAEQLKKQIKEKETNYYNPNRSWNGVTDGWYDY